MHVYELMVAVEDEVVRDYEEFMRRHYVPAVEATGCFRAVDFHRLTGRRYRLRLYADTEADLARYLRDHARRLRIRFTRRLPHGVTMLGDAGSGGVVPTAESPFERANAIVDRLRRATDL